MLLKDRFSIDSTGEEESCNKLWSLSGNFQNYQSHYVYQIQVTIVFMQRGVYFFLLQLQFPTLGFIVERCWEIQAHEPEEFWTINCSHESEDDLATKAENKYVMFYNLFIGFFGLIC